MTAQSTDSITIHSFENNVICKICVWLVLCRRVLNSC